MSDDDHTKAPSLVGGASMYSVMAGHEIGAPCVEARTPAIALRVAVKFRELGFPVVVIRDAAGNLVREADLQPDRDEVQPQEGGLLPPKTPIHKELTTVDFTVAPRFTTGIIGCVVWGPGGVACVFLRACLALQSL